jgi:hypothetical protein
MADITMCEGTDCLKREHCYRFKAIANPYRQSWFVNVPSFSQENPCEHFLELHQEARLYDLIDHETGEVYLAKVKSIEISDFVHSNNGIFMSTPSFVTSRFIEDVYATFPNEVM